MGYIDEKTFQTWFNGYIKTKDGINNLKKATINPQTTKEIKETVKTIISESVKAGEAAHGRHNKPWGHGSWRFGEKRNIAVSDPEVNDNGDIVFKAWFSGGYKGKSIKGKSVVLWPLLNNGYSVDKSKKIPYGYMGRLLGKNGLLDEFVGSYSVINDDKNKEKNYKAWLRDKDPDIKASWPMYMNDTFTRLYPLRNREGAGFIQAAAEELVKQLGSVYGNVSAIYTTLEQY